MTKRASWAATMVWCVLGCGTFTAGPARAPDAVQAADARAGDTDEPMSLAEAAAVLDVPTATVVRTEVGALPEAPWAGRPLGSATVPAELLQAWRQADNRGWCPPLMPDLMDGVAARGVSLDGGWALVFDAPGMAGVTADGDPCERCGMSAFGIAGTAANPDEWVELGAADLHPAYRDGTLMEVEREDGDEGALTATLVPSGQGCVYQVWTFLGEDHLRDLVAGLRHVTVPPEAPRSRIARARRGR
jgi:hypothetical protein